jgi:hypothetical protein
VPTLAFVLMHEAHSGCSMMSTVIAPSLSSRTFVPQAFVAW